MYGPLNNNLSSWTVETCSHVPQGMLLTSLWRLPSLGPAFLPIHQGRRTLLAYYVVYVSLTKDWVNLTYSSFPSLAGPFKSFIYYLFPYCIFQALELCLYELPLTLSKFSMHLKLCVDKLDPVSRKSLSNFQGMEGLPHYCPCYYP